MEQFRCIADLRGQLMESPVWDDRRGVLFACDIDGGKLYAIDLERGPVREWHFEAQVPCVGLAESGRLVVALAREIIVFDPETEARQSIWSGFDEPQASRLNDGKVGPDGALWIGSMDGRAKREPISKLYRVTADGRAEVKAEGFAISNGLAWTGDGVTMFHTDSRGPWIDRYDFDVAAGGVSGRRRISEPNEQTGRPDGGACDIEDAYWSAGVSAGVLNRFDRDGSLLQRLSCPVPAPTMPCFCGPDLSLLALTSHRLIAQEKLDAAPQSGSIFLAKAPVRGVKIQRMKGV